MPHTTLSSCTVYTQSVVIEVLSYTAYKDLYGTKGLIVTWLSRISADFLNDETLRSLDSRPGCENCSSAANSTTVVCGVNPFFNR